MLVRFRETCRLCDSPDVELVLSLEPSAIADAYVPAGSVAVPQPAYPLDLHLCRGCGHVQLLTVIDPEVLFGNYIYETASSPGLVEHFRKYAGDVTDGLRPREGSLVVDIGSNDGTLLRFFKDKGHRVLGVDGAREIARRTTEAGVETWPGFFTSDLARRIRTERGPAALVTANNVFAHADQMGDIADGVRELLAPDGCFLFEVSYLVDMMENMVFDWVYHEHLCYHSIIPLQSFFLSHGLELIDVRRVSNKGGSLRATVQHKDGPRLVAPDVGRFAGRERELGLRGPEPYRAFSRRIDQERDRLLGLLGPVGERGETVAGFGASATATTLLHHFRLGGVLKFICDDNPSRQGLFSPGFHIPVVSSRELDDQRPDYVVILAWRFAEPIVSKHQSYRENGGRFIVPLPRVSVR